MSPLTENKQFLPGKTADAVPANCVPTRRVYWQIAFTNAYEINSHSVSHCRLGKKNTLKSLKTNKSR